MSVRMSNRAMREIARINVSNECCALGVTYFPFVEPVEIIAHSEGKYGWTGNLFRGVESGVFYVCGRDFANECGHGGGISWNDLGFREREIMRNLESVSTGNANGHAYVWFVARDGSCFQVSTTDRGHRWVVTN